MIAWQRELRQAPEGRQLLLWYPPVRGALHGKCRVGILRDGDFRVYTAGGFLVMPDGPVAWVPIDAPAWDG